jgi:hypothetical protein
MPSSEYFRRQSDLCLRLAMLSTEDEVTRRLLAMAETYKTKAKERDRRPSTGTLKVSPDDHSSGAEN